jgi:putative addiction module CopG family antidote
MDASQERMATMNISLPEPLRRFVEARATERYSSASEYIRELVREDERRALAERTEAALVEGLASERFDRRAVKEAIEASGSSAAKSPLAAPPLAGVRFAQPSTKGASETLRRPRREHHGRELHR